MRFDAFGSVFALYARLRARQPVPYGALIGLPDGRAVLSLSPELFVRHDSGRLLARPMKGTAPACDDASAMPRPTTPSRAQALAADPKNRAENLMIVDLLRNDLGRIARTGSVGVPALFEVRRYSSVLQMTSTVQAQLRADAGLADIFDALYPCGSITGAPKRRTHGDHPRTGTGRARHLHRRARLDRSAGPVPLPATHAARASATSACPCRSAR